MDEPALEQLPLFGGLSRRARRRVAKVAHRIEVPQGTELVREGQVALELFVVVAGTAEVEREGRVVDVVMPGDFFGEIGAIEDGVRRNATVRAVSAMELVVIAAPDVQRLLDEVPDVAL